MSVTLTTQEIRQGSAGFLLRLAFNLNGYSDSYLGQTWRVRIICPDGTPIEKTTGIVFDTDAPLISVPIDGSDVAQAGKYYYQVTLTTSGAVVNSQVSSFESEGSLPDGLTYIGGGGGGGGLGTFTPGSVLFANDAGNATQDNSHFFYDATKHSLKLIDKNYVPLAGTLNSDCLFSVSSNDNQQNNPGVITTSNHFVGFSNDLKIFASGDSKAYYGNYTALLMSGDYTGTASVVGQRIYVNTRTGTGVTSSIVHGIETSVSIENTGGTTEAIGAVFGAFRGNSAPCPTFMGVQAVAANGYVTGDLIVGGNFIVRTISQGATITLGKAVWPKMWCVTGHTISDFRGVALDGWINTGTVTNSYGIYADTSIDVGTTSKYFIYSLSTSPSLFTGTVSVPDDAYNATTWDGNLTVPTKNAIRDKIESLSIGGGTPGGSDTYVQFNDGGVFGGSSGLTYNKTTTNLVVGGSINAGGITPVANVFFNASSVGVVPNGTVGSQVTLKKTGGTSGTIIGFRSDVSLNATMTNFNLHGGNFNVSTDTTGGVTPVLTSAFGVQTNINNVVGATLTNATGVYSGPVNNGTGTTWKGFYVQFSNVGASATLTNAYLVQPQLNANLLGTITNLIGVALTGWGPNTGTITNSYGIYADTSIDVGTTKYFIYSLSVSPSLFSGTVTVPDDAYDATTWDGNFTVPTKNAIRDKIEALSLGGGTPGGSNTQVQFNDSSAFGGSSGLTYDKTLSNLVVGNSVNAGGATPIANTYFYVNATGSLPTGALGYQATLKKTGGSAGTQTGYRVDLSLNATMTSTTMTGASFNVSTDTTGSVVPVLTNANGAVYSVTNAAGATMTNVNSLLASFSNLGTGTTWKGLYVQFTQVNAGASLSTVYLVQPQLNANLLGTIGSLMGIALTGWGSNTGTITNSYGIYADTSIDKGTNKYFIYSLSTSPSLFSGTVTVPDEAYSPTGWDNNLTVPTKNAIRDKIEVMAIESFVIVVSDETTSITTGTAKVTFRMPYAFTLTDVRATLSTASSSGNPTINIKEAGVSIFSTTLTIDSGEKTSTTAATSYTISDFSLADDAEITVDITAAGTGAKGLKIYLIGHKP